MIISIRKKAQEVSFVLLKIAGYIRHKELAARLESISYQLIESLYSDDFNTAMVKIEAAIGLSSLASNIGEMNQGNTAIILRELENLKIGIRQYQQTQESKDIPSVEGLFSKLTISAPVKPKIQSPSQKPKSDVMDERAGQVNSNNSLHDGGNAAIMRQDSILAKIRQANGSRLQLKDLIAAFPDISERTLRYDLVKLCQIGKLQREGAGGPSNFYVARSGGSPVLNQQSGKADLPIAGFSSNITNMGVINNKPMSL